MRKSIKIKSIIIDCNEISVEQIVDNKNGIKFYLSDVLAKKFDVFGGMRGTVSLDKIKVRTLKNKIYTLFDCFYTICGNNELYIHLIFSEIVRENVNVRNFKCDKLIVEFENTSIIKNKDFSENIDFDLNDISIKHLINKEKYEVIISSKNVENTEILFSYFADYFELISIIIGYFPTIVKKTYKNGKKEYVVENETIDKYITCDSYKKNDFGFLKKIGNDSFKNSYINYRKFSKKAILQLSMYFISAMKKQPYIEIKVVNILQTLDGIYNKLTAFENKQEDFSEDMNNEIKEEINKLDFSIIKKKYGNNIKINERINNCINRMNFTQYRKKLKNMFKYDNYLLFKEERKKDNNPFIKYDDFITKCYNSRNKLSHVDEKDVCLVGNENTTYIYKLTLLFRLLILQEIGLQKEINMSLLNIHILSINNYIKKVLV